MNETSEYLTFAAAEANNGGVDCLCRGDLSGALNLFRGALQDSKTAFSSTMPEVTTNSTRKSSSNYRAAIQARSDGGRSFIPASITQEEDEQAKSEISISVFSHPIGIKSTTGSEGFYFCNDLTIDKTIFSAIVIYNMALASQLMGRDSKDPVYLRRAGVLYAMCSQLLSYGNALPDEESGYQITGPGYAVCDLIRMAVLNNQAEICTGLADYQHAVVHLDLLIQLSSSMATDGYGDETVNSRMERARRFFLTNAVSSIHLGNAAAAA
jgi:hypothetical protein